MGLRSWLFKKEKKEIKQLKDKMEQLLRAQNELSNITNKLASIDKEHYYTPSCDIKLGVSSEIASRVIISNDIHMGDYSYIRERSIIGQSVNIGRYTAIARDVFISPWLHPTDWLSIHPFQYGEKYKDTEPVFIGNDVWIGTRVTIMDGVNIGHGAIIGAGAVVTKDIPPYAIAVGVPARVIKYRFSENIIQQLLELKWWDLDIETLQKNNVEFSNIETAIKQIKEIKKNLKQNAQ